VLLSLCAMVERGLRERSVVDQHTEDWNGSCQGQLGSSPAIWMAFESMLLQQTAQQGRWKVVPCSGVGSMS
jgi:phage gp37-like protein